MAEASKIILVPGDAPVSSPNGTKTLYYDSSGVFSLINDIGVVQTLSLSPHSHDDRYYTETEIDTALSTKENSFAKNTAFNKNFGTIADSTAEGDHTHVVIHPVNLDVIGTTYTAPVYAEPNRLKTLSVDTGHYFFSDNQITDNKWLSIGQSNHEDSGWIMPFDGTIIAMTAHVENCRGRTKDFSLFIDATENAAVITLSGGGEQQAIVSNMSLDFSAGNKLRLRGGTGGTIEDTVVSMYVKWRI